MLEGLCVMTNHHHKPNKPSNRSAEDTTTLTAEDEPLVNAETIAARYGVTGRYILQLASEGSVPCLRIGRRKCIRFSPKAVARAIETLNEKRPASEA